MATKVLMPKLSDTMTEGVILKWLRKEGDAVKQGEILVEIESDKADMELEAYDTGVVRKIFVPVGSKAPIGEAIAIIADADEDISGLLQPSAPSAGVKAATQTEVSTVSSPSQSAPAVPAPSALATDGRLKASPLARRIAEERQIDLRLVAGSGPQGRVVKRDLESVSAAAKPSASPTPAIPSGVSARIELSPIRKTIAQRMAQSKATAPHFYVTVEIDMKHAIAFRDQLNSVSDAKISFTDIIIKAASSALMKNPQVNASYQGEIMMQYGYTHIGVAVALESGLVTPVLRNCEHKGIAQINAELRDLAERARNRKLKPEEYQGATFTISNLGMFDVEDFVAIINPPEGAILAVGSILEKPVVKNGNVVAGKTMKVTLSSDHRIIDGVIAAQFLQDFRAILENPASLAL
ncbi:MAG: 2-oxo acid dehydrogenase subunit E2 [Ignavibacteria bacterium]|nr:2-oxo acid dehydrogenase subunit E2 [Ignavibacteria bacterium]